MHTITPCLWFDGHAEEAAHFYVSVFSSGRQSVSEGTQSKIISVARYGEAASEVSGMAKGTVMTVEFQLGGQHFVALNGGPVFKFNEAISFQVHCQTQEEIDHYWDKLSEGGDQNAQQCGWLKDKYGMSWQIVPTVLPKMLQDKDTQKTNRVMKALLQMQKLDIKRLEQAYERSQA